MATKEETKINPVEAVEIVKADKAVEAVKVIEPVKTKVKRLSKSKRTHVRRMKAEARNAGNVYRPDVQ